MRTALKTLVALTLVAAPLAAPLAAQTSTPVTTNNGNPPPSALPATPAPQLPAAGVPQTPAPTTQQPTAPAPPPVTQLPPSITNTPVIPPNAPTLTLAQAEQLAIAHNPRITVSHLLALAEGEVTREQRAAELPTLGAAITAVGADNGTRLTAGALNNPTLYQRAAAGVTLNQLLTDFGRTRNLVASAQLRTQAAQSTEAATRNDIVYAVDQAFFRALGAQAVIQVATETVSARQATANQIQALTNSHLRSTLDLSLANSALAQAQLLLLDARNQSASAQADLSALLGDSQSTVYRLTDETTNTPAPPPDAPAPLIQQALTQRPDLLSLKDQADAAHRFASAEHDLSRPTISALGAAGDAPVRVDQIPSGAYGAVGLNITIPVFNGFLYSARAGEAGYRASAADAQVADLRNSIARDVTTTVLQAQSNFNRIAVAQQLAAQAAQALQLAQTRYNLGLSSIVELSQAELLDIQSRIELENARYAYQGSLSAIRYQTGQ